LTITADEFFSPDYFSARSRFRELATAAHGALESIPLDASGPNGESLSIDIASFGAASARHVLLHSSGLHGVEGFGGSAIQLQALSDVPDIAANAALILVHILNPYGMAWLRRVNENNVDLNRNFLEDGKYTSYPNPLYSKCDWFLNPPTPPARDMYYLKAARLSMQYGVSALKQAIAGGQYEHPRGLFFGGQQLQQGAREYQSFLARRLASAESVIAIDVHTGLGRYSEDMLMVEAADRDEHESFKRMFGNRVAPFDPATGRAYFASGGLGAALRRLAMKADVRFVTQEFGTYSAIKVLHALREENRWHHYGDGAVDHPTKGILKSIFCPDDPSWRRAVLERGQALLRSAITYV
jgi:hypothetical protein